MNYMVIINDGRGGVFFHSTKKAALQELEARRPNLEAYGFTPFRGVVLYSPSGWGDDAHPQIIKKEYWPTR